jgi:hypothetical protein
VRSVVWREESIDVRVGGTEYVLMRTELGEVEDGWLHGQCATVSQALGECINQLILALVRKVHSCP